MRYVVEMNLAYQGQSKPVEVNLNNRDTMTYPLLLGRKLAQCDYLVDVELPKSSQNSNSVLALWINRP